MDKHILMLVVSVFGIITLVVIAGLIVLVCFFMLQGIKTQKVAGQVPNRLVGRRKNS